MSADRHGVTYTPSTVERVPSVNLEDDKYLDSLGVKYIRITWQDYTNKTRYRVVPRKYFKKLLQSSRPGITLAKVSLALVFLAVAPGFTGTGSWQYVIDPTSFRLAPYAPGHATVFGYFQEKTSSPQYGLTVPLCPRWLLKQILEKAESAANVSYLVGFESEFILLSSTSPHFTAVNSAEWSVSSKLPSGSVEYTVMEEIAQALEGAGIELQMYHAEAAPGQYEVVTGPLPPIEAADALIQTRETIYNIANKHGLRATFAPKPFPSSTGNGAHTNISVHSSNPQALLNHDTGAHLGPTMKAHERSFLQGVLSHLPALCALTLPTRFSYDRVGDGNWSGGTYASWGTENREAAIRLTGSPSQHHFECRFIDATANPHLLLAGVLGAGTQALIDGTPLQSGDCDKPVAEMTTEEKRKMGVLNAGRVPQSLAQARQNLEGDHELKKILGDTFVLAYLSVNKTLEELLVGENEGETLKKVVDYY